jgi:hypothetical protein
VCLGIVTLQIVGIGWLSGDQVNPLVRWQQIEGGLVGALCTMGGQLHLTCWARLNVSDQMDVVNSVKNAVGETVPGQMISQMNTVSSV